MNMKTKIIMIRHGQSQANAESRFAGHSDFDLTDLGRQQAKCAADYLRKCGIVPDVIYSSDLKRAHNTALPIAEEFGLPINDTEGLREIFAGDWEGRLFDEIKEEYPDLFGCWFGDNGNCRCPNGESVAELGQRVFECLAEIGEENRDLTVAVATHATPIRALQAITTYGSVSEIKKVPWVSNASVSTVIYDKGTFTFEESGYDKHLIGLTTELPKDI